MASTSGYSPAQTAAAERLQALERSRVMKQAGYPQAVQDKLHAPLDRATAEDCDDAASTATPTSPPTVGCGVELGDLPLSKLLQFLPAKWCFRMAMLSEQYHRALVIQGKHIVPWLVCSKESKLDIDHADLVQKISLENVICAWFMASPDALDAVRTELQAQKTHLAQIQRFSAKGCKVGVETIPLIKSVFASGEVTLFNLELNQLNDATVKALVSDVLMHDQNLETLCIRSNRLGDAAAEHLSKLAYHPTLKFLNLKQNSIGKDGATALAGFLEDNRSLHNLNLRAQTPKLPAAAGVILAGALMTNGTLRRLKLRRNRMDDTVAEALVEPLTTGPARLSMIEVDLQQNVLTATGGATLARVLMQNSVLEVVYVGGHAFGPSEVNQRNGMPPDERMKFEIFADV